MIVEFLDLFLQLNLQPSSIEDGDVDTVAGGHAYFTETSKDYNSFKIESEVWLPTTAQLATNLFKTENEDHQPLAWVDNLFRNQASFLFQLDVVGLPC